MSRRAKRQTGALAAAVLILAAAVFIDGTKQPARQAAAGGGAVAVRMEVLTPPVCLDVCSPEPNTVITDGSSISGYGNVVINGYATPPVTGQYRFRVSYGFGINTTDARGHEAWYPLPKETLPGGSESAVISTVQDLDSVSDVTFVGFGVPGSSGPATSLTFAATNLEIPSEGTKSVRPLISGPLVDQVRIDITDYKTNVPVPCGGSDTSSGRVNESIKFFASTGMFVSVHTHMERPGSNGPDQDGDPANNRWWEFTTPQTVWVPANSWTEVMQVVANTTTGTNVFHAGEISSDGRKIETFCSFDTG